MSEKNTRPVAGTTERADRNACRTNYKAASPRSQALVSSVLGVGRQNAIPAWELVQILGLRDVRTLTQLVERERRAGAPICASVTGVRGYYIANNPAELSAYLRSLDHRLGCVSATRRHLQEALDAMTGQKTVEGW